MPFWDGLYQGTLKGKPPFEGPASYISTVSTLGMVANNLLFFSFSQTFGKNEQNQETTIERQRKKLMIQEQ